MTMRFKPHDLFFWALCSGLVIVAAFVLFIALACATPPAYADDEIKDDLCTTPYKQAHFVMGQGAEVFFIENADEVARGAGFINRSGGTAIGVTGFLVAVYTTLDLGEIYPIIDGKSCGYNRSNRADALEFMDIIKQPDGDPA